MNDEILDLTDLIVFKLFLSFCLFEAKVGSYKVYSCEALTASQSHNHVDKKQSFS